MIESGFSLTVVKKLHSPALFRTIGLRSLLLPIHSENLMSQHAFPHFALISILMFSAASFAQQPAPATETPKDTITSIFTGEFSERPSHPPRWFDGGQSYIAREPAAGGHGRDREPVPLQTGPQGSTHLRLVIDYQNVHRLSLPRGLRPVDAVEA